VHVLESAQQHLCKPSRLLLVVVGLGNDAIEELAPRYLLKHEVEVPPLLEQLVSSHDVGVRQGLQHADFIAN